MRFKLLLIVIVGFAVNGCAKHRASVTAVPLSPWNQCEPHGIPYYLPKPLLVVAKNVRHVDESKVGLTNPVPIPNAFDSQASYADVKANVTVPGEGSGGGIAATNIPPTALPGQFDPNAPTIPGVSEQMMPPGRIDDGLAPDTFYTYQVVFIPDLTQKYGLRIKGGPGEIRAAMNLVNGWMYTGMGPFYLKDSSTAQNIMAAGVGAMYAGRGAADVLNSAGNLTRAGGGAAERAPADASDLLENYAQLAQLLKTQNPVPKTMLNYAQIFVYEPELTPEGTMFWKQIASHSFDREYFQPGMDANSFNLFQRIIDSQNQQTTAQGERARADAERARADMERTSSSTMGDGTQTLPGGIPRQSTPAGGMGNSIGSANQFLDGYQAGNTDIVLGEVDRRVLGLSNPASSPAGPGTQVNVKVDSENQGGRWWNALPRLFQRDKPKYESRQIQYFDSTPAGPAIPPSNLEYLPGFGQSISN